jgi:ubiquitin-protein ligase
MKRLTLTVSYRDGMQHIVEASSDVLVSKLAGELAITLSFLESVEDGVPISIQLDRFRTNETLRSSETLEQNGVKNGDHLLLWAAYPREILLRLERMRLEKLVQENDFFGFAARFEGPISEPYFYTLRFRIIGIQGISQKQEPIYGEEHRVSMLLDDSFPEWPPMLRWETPIWHPNVQHLEPKGVMVRAWWAPGQGLDALVKVLMNMAQYRIYHAENTPPYPLDHDAARWVREYGEPNRIVDRTKGLLSPRNINHRIAYTDSVNDSVSEEYMNEEIKVKVNTMGGEQHEVQTPSNITGDDFIHELCIALKLPTIDADHNPITWSLDNKDTGHTIEGQRNLASAGVKDGHTLLLIRATVAGCFLESARVLLPDGTTTPIGKIRSSDSILVYDMDSDSYASGKVEGIYQQTYSEQIVLNNHLITTADQHLLLADRSWRLTSDIEIGDVLLKFPFGELKVVNVQKEKNIKSMFSLTLKHSLCLVVEGLVVRDLIGKQAYLPRAVDVFLSYATVDKDEARMVFDSLEEDGASVFLAERSIKAGDFWEDRIKEALKNCRSFWILITPNSLNSEWVNTEWVVAWALGKKIVPILYRCKPEDLPKRLQSYQCIDFHRIGQAVESIRRNKWKT